MDNERGTSNDVTEEYTDLRSRLRILEATEQQLFTILGQAKNTQELLQVQDRLNQIRTEIERVKGRINLYERITELATILVQLRPETAPPPPPPAVKAGPRGALAALQRGWDASNDLLGGVALVLLTVVGFSWWLLPLLVLAWWLARRELRRRGSSYVPAVSMPADGA